MTTVTIDPPVESAPPLVCWKVWGGNRRINTPISIPGFSGALHSTPIGSDRGGDLYYMSACGSGALARLCIADVTGHGSEVATFSTWLEEVFSANIHGANPSAVLKKVNQRAVSRGLEVMSTAICFSYNSCNGKFSFCNAGHPRIRICREGSHSWEMLALESRNKTAPWNIPLGITNDTVYELGQTRLKPGDILILHTDGLSEAMDSNGKQLNETLWETGNLPDSSLTVADIANAIQKKYEGHIGNDETPKDDMTFIVLKVSPYQKSGKYVLLLKNNLERLRGVLKR